MKFLVGLANDEVGYIIPKSEWDDAAPWLYGAPERHYGEINSLGPETAPLIHQALKDLVGLVRRVPAPVGGGVRRAQSERRRGGSGLQYRGRALTSELARAWSVRPDAGAELGERR